MRKISLLILLLVCIAQGEENLIRTAEILDSEPPTSSTWEVTKEWDLGQRVFEKRMNHHEEREEHEGKEFEALSRQVIGYAIEVHRFPGRASGIVLPALPEQGIRIERNRLMPVKRRSPLNTKEYLWSAVTVSTCSKPSCPSCSSW